MKYLYRYSIVCGKKIEAEIRKYEILIETNKQWVYRCFDKYYTQDKVDIFGKPNASGCYVEGNQLKAYLYTSNPSEDCQLEIRNLIDKEVSKKFGFVEKLKELEITFKEVSYE